VGAPGSLRVLAIGAHPDDIELFAGGTVALLAAAGHRVVLADLTRGEMGSRGTPAERRQESRRAAEILGAALRVDLDLGDGRLDASLPNRHALAALVRQQKPDLVLAPEGDDPHPDHAAAGALVDAALFDARLAKLDLGHPPHASGRVLRYAGHLYREPQVVIDIEAVFERKMEAIRCYRSQFGEAEAAGAIAPVGIRDYLWQIETRSRQFGHLVNRRYGEGFRLRAPILLAGPELLPCP
jgi:bacillithiol biosynthesis deacetylase BshB1